MAGEGFMSAHDRDLTEPARSALADVYAHAPGSVAHAARTCKSSRIGPPVQAHPRVSFPVSGSVATVQLAM